MSDVVELLIVCTGNIARSPFAAALLEREARARLGADAAVWVRSAGVHGLDGNTAVQEMRDLAPDHGVDLSTHRGARVTAGDLESADLVLATTEAQRDHLIRMRPEARDRVFTLKELARLLDGADLAGATAGPGRLREVARTAASRRAHAGAARTREDVLDPYGGSRAEYQQIADELVGLVRALAPKLFGGA